MKKKRYSSGEEQISILYYWWILLRLKIRELILQFRDFQSRRPHRSFKLTRRRDYVRPTEIPGYWRFSKRALSMILQNKKQFLPLIFLISSVNFLLIGLLDQDFITSLQDVVQVADGGLFKGGWGEIGKAGLVVMSTFSTGGLVKSPNQAQQLMMFFILLLTILSVLQVCRNILSGNRKLTLRDALYSCGAPIVPMGVVACVVLVQAIPLFIGIILASAASLTNFASSGVEQLVFAAAVFLLFAISIYWILGSLFGLIIVSIPGTYPMQALKIAGNMVSQRRLAISFRIVWCVLMIFLVWAIFVIPLVILVTWLGNSFEILKAIPIIQIAMLFVTSFSMVYASTYIYLLYREIVDYDRKN